MNHLVRISAWIQAERDSKMGRIIIARTKDVNKKKHNEKGNIKPTVFLF